MFVSGAAFSNEDASERDWSRAGEMTALSDKPFVVDVFWSMRSLYCYIALDRKERCQSLQFAELHYAMTDTFP